MISTLHIMQCMLLGILAKHGFSKTLPGIPEVKTDLDMKCREIRPGLQGAFGFHCFLPTSMMNSTQLNHEPSWRFEGKSIYDSQKYHMGKRQYKGYFNGEMMPIYDMHLVITDINGADVGMYDIEVETEESMLTDSMPLTSAHACGDHPTCYEDNCRWPAPLRCKSIPEARCQMDMCNKDNWCWPVWFVGAKQVECDEVESDMPDFP